VRTADAYGWHCDNIIIFAGFSETGSADRGSSDGGRAGARGPVAPPNSFPPPPDSHKWGGSTERTVGGNGRLLLITAAAVRRRVVGGVYDILRYLIRNNEL